MSGEMSLSVEATNILRAKVGLPPLAVGSVAMDDDARLREELVRRRQVRARKQAEQSQQQHQQHMSPVASQAPKPKPKSLGESLAAQGKAESAASWVQQAKEAHARAHQEEERAKQEEFRRREVATQTGYDSDDIRNLKVGHGVDGLEEGDEVILTLKDSNILDGDSLNLSEDELENVKMIDSERTKEHNDRRGRRPRYDVFGEDPEDDSVLLAKYSEKKRQASIRLGDLYAVSDAEANRDDEGRKVFSLETERKIMGEFKPVKFKRNKKKDKKERASSSRTPKSILDELLPEPEQQDAAARQQDHSSREVSAASLRLQKEEGRRRALADQSYLQALRQAERQRLGGAAIKVDHSEIGDAADDDPLLRASLERARQANLQRSRQASSAPQDPATRLRNQLAQLEEQRRQAAATATVKAEPQVNGGSAESSEAQPEATAVKQDHPEDDHEEVVFTETTEFCQVLESSVDEMRQQRERRRRLQELSRGGVKQEDGVQAKRESGRDWRMDVSDEDKSSDDEQDQASGGGRRRVKTEDGGDQSRQEEEEEEEDGNLDDDFTAEPVVGDGLASFLKLARQRGLLHSDQTQFGRNKDKVLMDNEDDPAPHLRLGVYDEEGNLLKPKEAFRYISYAFHGHKPGAKKREKRIKAMKDQHRQAEPNPLVGFAGLRRPRESEETREPSREAKRQRS